MKKYQKVVKNPAYGVRPERQVTIWVQNLKIDGGIYVELDMNIAHDHDTHQLTADAAINLGLALIDIGRRVKNLQLAGL